MDLQAWVSEERFRDYLSETGNDYDKAVELYRWNASMSAALFEVIHHFEVLLRNKIVDTLIEHPPTSPVLPGSPWLNLSGEITDISNRLRKKNQEVTAGKIYSNLTFGAWVNMFVPDANEELWRQTLRHVMPNAKIDRSVAASYLQSINELRNRVAHHSSLLGLDPLVEYRKTIQVAEWIDKEAAEWIDSISQDAIKVLSDRRQDVARPLKNVMLVPAGGLAWTLYKESSQPFYICPANRKNRPIERIAFYADREIKQIVPKVLDYRAAVNFNDRSAKSLEKTDKEISKLVKAALHCGFSHGTYQVYYLSPSDSSDTHDLGSPIPNISEDGRHGALQGKMYLSLSQLSSARSTSQLLSN
ncbi:Abi family protein [Rothia sp. L_38]|uniref:Abi family protein n=1 Tax=Rothia sp. L_38 TaxID=3422315 RepID=UPI003D6A5845